MISTAGDRTNNHSMQMPKTLPLGHRIMLDKSDAELTNDRDNARPLDLMCLEGTYSLQTTQLLPELAVSSGALEYTDSSSAKE